MTSMVQKGSAVAVSEEEGGLHCLSRDESRRAYEASHLGRAS
jgi:hypothetical protein